MAKLTKNTRKHKRLKSFYLLKYQTGSAAGDSQLTNVSDISAGGLRFQTAHPIEKGTKIKIAVLIPSFEKPIDAEAEVVWVGKSARKNNPYSVAVKFSKIASEYETELEEFFKKLVSEKKNPLFIDLPNFSFRK